MKKIALGTFAFSLLASTSVLAGDVYVKDIKIHGLERVEPETVKSYIEIEKARLTDDAKINEALKKLYATGLFEDVAINMSDNIMHIKVSENPVISEVLFDGNDEIDDKMLESEIRLSPRSTF